MSIKSILAFFLFTLFSLSCSIKVQKNTSAPPSNEAPQYVKTEKSKGLDPAASTTVDIPKKMADCIDPSRRRMEKGCPDELKEVCGCNGKTYRNSCEADREGVTHYSPGKCIPTADY
jgi:hypothetical protein